MKQGNQAVFTNGSQTRYIYDASGVKLKRIHITAVDNIVVPLKTVMELSDDQILTSDTTEYLGNLVFENGRLDKVLFSSGYVSCNDDDNQERFTFHYFVKDHLGNNRAVVNESGAIEQTTHYYPFGNSIADIGTNASIQQYKYNGKELDRMHGLDWYDYGARNYDPVILQWDRPDPLADKYYPVSPYIYCMGNPVNSIDPDGRKIVIAGNREQRLRVLTELQRLTNDKLGVNYNGVVTIMANGTKNTGMKLTTGTSLISELIGHEKTVNIIPGDSYRERGIYRKDELNGKGSNAKVWYDFDTPVPTIVRDRKTGKRTKENIPRHIALGHELIHAHRSMNGVAKDINKMTQYSYEGIDGILDAPIEELETTGIKDIDGSAKKYKFTENKLREEENLNERLRYHK